MAELQDIVLLTIGTTAIKNPMKGNLTINRTDLYNKIDFEDGSATIELIREGMLSGSVTYNGLFISDINTIMGALSTVVTLTVYTPFNNTTSQITALITNITTKNIITKQAESGTNPPPQVNAWSLSFNFQQIS